MDELSQWCEIDGHMWQECHFHKDFGYMYRTVEIFKTCLKCRKEEHKIFVPSSTPFRIIPGGRKLE